VDCQPGLQTRRVHQYGVDYIHLECGDSVTLEFGGDLETNLVPAGAHSGDYAFWSNKGDQTDMTLTRTFDFRDHEGPLTLEFWTWFDIETDWDYVYVLASTDGERWDFLKTPSGTNTDPSGNNYEWGLTGLSGGIGEWILESVDISPYAGKEVQLRFEYITDTAVNGEGMLIDDIAVPEVGYFSDLEDGDGGWTAEGFARVTNLLPQTFQVALITLDSGMRVDYLPLDAANRLTLELDFSAGQEYVLVVVGTTRFTRQVAEYWFDFLR
ncbi:MAG: immune inhibitor A, partial [Anaerolineae bacterium]|nr:immune inhibitor A [Anaerolineae bacterium]